MNKEEIEKALEIVREPIIVNCIDYHYFDNENYNNLVRIFENCLWFVNNLEQIIETSNQLQQKIKTYEDPEDLTLMFMYCDEKAKDKIKDLQQRITRAIEYIGNKNIGIPRKTREKAIAILGGKE
jgi:hypothetical protein